MFLKNIMIIIVFVQIFLIHGNTISASEIKRKKHRKFYYGSNNGKDLQVEEEGILHLDKTLNKWAKMSKFQESLNYHNKDVINRNNEFQRKKEIALRTKFDPSKIQSNSKDITTNTGNYFIFGRNNVLPPKSLAPLKKHVPFLAANLTSDTYKIEQEVKQSQYLESKNSSHQRTSRAVVANKNRLWDNGIIPYEIDKIFSGAHKALFIQAMKHWENFTCIKFVERNPNEHRHYIYFTVRNCGCCAFVGKRGNGRQYISIGRNCEKFGIVVHELGHVLGFWHEHTRIDRDQHIQINEANILKGQEYNFNMLSPEDVDSLGLPYDYNSIMHYAKNTFSKSIYLDTISPKRLNGELTTEMGQRSHLSQGDIDQANLLYKCPKCGKTIQQNSGIISSSNSGAQSKSEKCEWRITATQGERIILNVTEMNLPEIDNCEENFLEVRDGYWYKSPLIKRLCGNFTSPIILSTISNRMTLTYVNTKAPDGYVGFTANYKVICGGQMYIENQQRIDSPNYPLNYPADKECIWIFTVPKGFEVALTFQSFDFENHESCSYDYVEIRDGNNADSPLIGIFCGYKKPPNIKANSNHMFVKFVSDGSTQRMGFSAIVMKELDECKTNQHGCDQQCINVLGGYECDCDAGYELHANGQKCENSCGGVIEDTTGVLHSPKNFESSHTKQCVWEIVAPKQHNIFLNFSQFSFEDIKSSDCKFDYIRIYSKLPDSRLRKIGQYCGNELPPLLKTDENVMRIEFSLNKRNKGVFTADFMRDFDECSVNNGGCEHYCQNTYKSYECSCRNGFNLSSDGHSCNETTCKFEITAPYGVILSPNYPEPYTKDIYCYWHFKTLPGHRISLTFNEFEIEEHQECIYDYVGVYDGASENSSTLGIFCGERPAHTILASGNEMYMVLRTDNSLQGKGFMATYSTECGGFLQAKINETNVLFSHPRFGLRPYSTNMYCTWKIEAIGHKSVKLKFLFLEIEFSQRCNYDYVEIFEEMSFSRTPYHGKFCGNKKPREIVSKSDTLFVHFQSDESTTFKGFSIAYEAVDPPLFDEKEEDEPITPFPGYMGRIFSKQDFDEYDEPIYSKNEGMKKQ